MAAVPGQKKKSKKTKIPPRDTLTEGQVRERAHVAFCAVWGAQCSPVLPPLLGSHWALCARLEAADRAADAMCYGCTEKGDRGGL